MKFKNALKYGIFRNKYYFFLNLWGNIALMSISVRATKLDIILWNLTRVESPLIQWKFFHGQACLFNKNDLNVCQIYILNKYATFSDKYPPWLNNHISFWIKEEKAALQKYLKNGRTNATYTNLQKKKKLWKQWILITLRQLNNSTTI